jgi:hypothetical protein
VKVRAKSAPALFPAGEIMGRFTVEGVLGIGGTGTVFHACEIASGEHVAIKAIPQDGVLRQRAKREAVVAGRLDHPNVVRLLEVLEDEDYVYVVSELVDGGDLHSALRAGDLTDAERVRVVAAVCSALAHAHARGVVHRDVKPANVLLGRDGSVRLADFGIAALSDPEATVDDRLLGTLSYMAPETCKGDPPAAPADVWGAGILLYEAMTGANPFRARTPDELADRHGARARPLGEVRPDLPRSLLGACSRALATSPRRRPSAAALAQTLDAAADELDRAAGRRVLADVIALPRRGHGPGLRIRASRSVAAFGQLLGSVTHGHLEQRTLVRAESVAARLGPPLCVALATASALALWPFWPHGFIAPIAGICALVAFASPWLAAALALAAFVPAAGNLSAGLAWAVAIMGAVWLLACVGAGRRALLPALAPPLAAVLAWPAYLALAGRRASLCGRLLAGAAGPVAIALWHAGPAAAEDLRGSGSTIAAGRALLHGAQGAVALQALGWALAAAAWPLVWRAPGARRPLLLAAWLSLALVAQGLAPGLAGGLGQPVWAPVLAVWIAGIVVWLAVDLTGGAASGAESRS